MYNKMTVLHDCIVAFYSGPALHYSDPTLHYSGPTLYFSVGDEQAGRQARKKEGPILNDQDRQWTGAAGHGQTVDRNRPWSGNNGPCTDNGRTMDRQCIDNGQTGGRKRGESRVHCRAL